MIINKKVLTNVIRTIRVIKYIEENEIPPKNQKAIRVLEKLVIEQQKLVPDEEIRGLSFKVLGTLRRNKI